MIFAKNEKLVELESESKWKEAVELLRDQWYKDRHNNNSLLRLATECWYLLSNWGILDLASSELEFHDVQSILIETYNYMLEFGRDVNLNLAMFGYMVSLFPNYFYVDLDQSGKLYLQFEKQGKEMLKKAFTNEPQNQLYGILYLGSSPKFGDSQNESYGKLEVRKLFPGDTLVEKYFQEVLSW